MNIIQFKEANCKNCYKCIRYCAVKAIKFKSGQARIIGEDCVYCGKCTIICPQDTKHIQSDLDIVKKMIADKAKVYVSLAPSFVSAFPDTSFGQVSAALKKLGFVGVEETAVGAVKVTKEYDRLVQEKKMKNIITTCCPTVNLIVQKYYPELTGQLAPVVAPATAHGRMLKNIYGSRAKVVFIGPCISKKYEAAQGNDINAVLMFDELRQWLAEEQIEIGETDEKPSELHDTATRLYPTCGGILETMKKEVPEDNGYKRIAIDGPEWIMETLDALRDEKLSGYFIEMSACLNSCIGGPGLAVGAAPVIVAQSKAKEMAKKVTKTPTPMTEESEVPMSAKYEHMSAREKVPDDETIRKILLEIGKTGPESMLNCGGCGYETCRAKAIAVYQGKANLKMCMPYLRERAESMSNLILDHTPNIVFVIDKDMKILHFNKAAQKMFNVDKSIVKSPITLVFNTTEIERLKDPNETKYLRYRDEAEKKSLELMIIPAVEGEFIIIAKDISKAEDARSEMEKIRRETIETTQQVIDKQMRVAQEIASLLGETTGETKTVLTKLKRTILAGDDL